MPQVSGCPFPGDRWLITTESDPAESDPAESMESTGTSSNDKVQSDVGAMDIPNTESEVYDYFHSY